MKKKLKIKNRVAQKKRCRQKSVEYRPIREELKQIDWNVCMSGDTIECWNNFKDVLLDLKDKLK